MKKITASLVAVALFAGDAASVAAAQDYAKYSQEALEKELARIAVSRPGVMVRMRDGVALSTDVYMPKQAKGKLPTILWKTPYNEHKLKGGTMRYVLESVKRGYTFIVQNERGRYFSQGQWEILGKPQTDGYDTLSWIAAQDWSNGKVGTLGCSSSAEWQLALAGLNHPAHAAMVPMASGAGIGKVGRFQEQGNWYTGGVPRNLFFVWLYGVDNPLRAELPASLTDEKLRARVEAYNDLDASKPKVDWNRQIRHLPVDQLLSSLGEPAGTFEQLIKRSPADPAWRQGGLYHEGMGWGVPALWFNSWYDVSIGPNLELFNHARAAGTDKEASANQYAVVAPVPHCQFARLGPDTTVGERAMATPASTSTAPSTAGSTAGSRAMPRPSRPPPRTCATSRWAPTSGAAAPSGRRSRPSRCASTCARAAAPIPCTATAACCPRPRPPARHPTATATTR